MWFASDLLRLLSPNFVMESACVSSYDSAHETSGKVTWRTPVPYCEGKRVLDSGVTLANVKAELLKLGATEVATAVMVDKPEGRRVAFAADYVGLFLPISSW